MESTATTTVRPSHSIQAIAARDPIDVEAHLSIGTNSRSMGFAFDLLPEQVALLAKARCGVWIDSYEPNRDRRDLPDDYPYPEGGDLRPARGLARARARLARAVRAGDPLGRMRRHLAKTPERLNDRRPTRPTG